MEVLLIISFFVLGAVLGSFYNVVGIRLPKKIPFHKGRSYCPSCKQQLKFYELIPILSYLIQVGRCRNCRVKISPVYPLMEFMTGFFFAFAYIKLGFQVELLVALSLISLFVIITVSDLYYMLIPDKVLLFFLPIFLILRLLVPLEPWYDMFIGAIVGYLLLAVIIIVSKGGMGAGDMKLFALIGMVLGWKKVLLTFFLSALFGALIGGGLMAMKKIQRGQPIPFGPFIVIAGLITYFYGESILDWYFSLM